jgi:hypothetical protein
MRFKVSFQYVIKKDRELHDWFKGHFPGALPAVDGFLEWLFSVVTHPAFGLIVALLLVTLVATNVINLIVATSIAGVWIVALIWIARSKLLKSLTILSRWILVSVIGFVLGLAGNDFGTWVLRQYNQHKASEDHPIISMYFYEVHVDDASHTVLVIVGLRNSGSFPVNAKIHYTFSWNGIDFQAIPDREQGFSDSTTTWREKCWIKLFPPYSYQAFLLSTATLSLHLRVSYPDIGKQTTYVLDMIVKPDRVDVTKSKWETTN